MNIYRTGENCYKYKSINPTLYYVYRYIHDTSYKFKFCNYTNVAW